ncbi:hypothetical protein A8F97_13490 [Pectobacterium parmentieri]|nr:hypothetical protein A8F97_13490 [Pectobacterium parmentieri]
MYTMTNFHIVMYRYRIDYSTKIVPGSLFFIIKEYHPPFAWNDIPIKRKWNDIVNNATKSRYLISNRICENNQSIVFFSL